MSEKILTLFRTKSSKDGKILSSLLKESEVGLEQECIQTVYMEQNADITTFFGIKANPTILLFEQGEEVRRYEGLISLPSLREFIAD
jgi:thioredoxin-like negative regulator of GroEL